MKSCASCKFIEGWSWSWDDPMSEGRYHCKLTKEWVGADYIDPPTFKKACEKYERMKIEFEPVPIPEKPELDVPF